MKKPEYCTNDRAETCRECNLVNYGRDCMNNKVDDRRHQNPGRPRVQSPRVRVSTTVAPETYALLAAVPPRQRGRLIDRWAEDARCKNLP